MADPGAPRLVLAGLEKAYEMGHERIAVVRGLDLHVGAGEVVAIMGPSGAGKTTLLNCISGIDLPDAGDVRINGRSLAGASARDLTLLRRNEIGMVFQFFNLVPSLTVRENVGLPFLIMGQRNGFSHRRVDELLDRMGLGARADHYSFQLSGGEMQLVSIARALVHEPSLLLADEPTGNVNRAVGRSIMETLIATARERATAVLLVTHSAEHAAWADRICFLKDGVIAKERSHGGAVDNVSAIYDELMALDI